MNNKSAGFSFDPRVNLVLVLLSASTMFVISGKTATFSLFGIVLLMSVLNAQFMTAIKFTVYFAVMYALSAVIPGAIQVLITTFVLRGLALGLAATVLMKASDTSEVLASLRQMKVPDELMIPISVMLRFFPALKQDIRYIRFGMRTRGIKIGGKSPMTVYELYLVPLIMRMLKTAGNLSAAAETRGISWEGKKSSYTIVEVGIIDAIAIIGLFAIYGSILFF